MKYLLEYTICIALASANFVSAIILLIIGNYWICLFNVVAGIYIGYGCIGMYKTNEKYIKKIDNIDFM